jgi:Flp pilus assembly protein TadD
MTSLARAQELFFAALEAQGRKQLDIAERFYREALALAPDRPGILNNLAESRVYCERLLSLNSADADAWMISGYAQSGLKLWPEALASCVGH